MAKSCISQRKGDAFYIFLYSCAMTIKAFRFGRAKSLNEKCKLFVMEARPLQLLQSSLTSTTIRRSAVIHKDRWMRDLLIPGVKVGSRGRRGKRVRAQREGSRLWSTEERRSGCMTDRPVKTPVLH